MLNKDKILKYLPPALPVSVEVLDTAVSTNTMLKQLAREGAPEGTVLLARQQTGGRGRLGRSFLSERDKGLYMSLLLRPELPAERLMGLTGLAAVASATACEEACTAPVGIKWVNDLILRGKKLGGILTELCLSPEGIAYGAVIGIGINLLYTGEAFAAAGLDGIATSFLAEGLQADENALAARLIAQYLSIGRPLKAGSVQDYLAQYRCRCITLQQPVRVLYPEGAVSALALDIDDNFGLVVKSEEGKISTVSAGEVSVRGYYGYV